MPIDCEPYSSLPLTWSSAIDDWDDAGVVLSNAEEDGLGEVKVVEGRVAPAAGVIRKCIIGRTEIGCSDQNRAMEAPFRVINALDFITRPTVQPIVEKSSANCCSVGSVAFTVKIPIPTSSTHCPGSIAAAVEGGMSINPGGGGRKE